MFLLLLVLQRAWDRYVSDKEDKQRVDDEISRLGSDADRCAYLRSIFDADQFPRVTMVGEGGFPSEAERAKAMKDTDRVNAQRIERYLRAYGYPKRSTCEELAVVAPWTVLHHSSDDAFRTRWTPVLLGAFRSGDLGESEIAWFLKRSHQLRFGTDLEQGQLTNAENDQTFIGFASC